METQRTGRLSRVRTQRKKQLFVSKSMYAKKGVVSMHDLTGSESNKLNASPHEQTYKGEAHKHHQKEGRAHRFPTGKALAAGAGLAGLIALRQRHKHTHTPHVTRAYPRPSMRHTTLHGRGRGQEGFLGNLRRAVFH